MSESIPNSLELRSRMEDISTHASVLGQPEAVLQRYGKAIRKYLHALLCDDTDAAEAASDFTIKVLSGFAARWSRKGRFREFLKTSVRNAALDYLRKKPGREKQVDDLSSFPDQRASSNDVWLGLYRSEVFEAARKELQAYQDSTPGNFFATLIELLIQNDDSDSSALAARLAHATGSPCTPANARKQKERARRKFAELLLDQIRPTLEEPTSEQIQDELRVLGFFDYVAEFLPHDSRPADC